MSGLAVRYDTDELAVNLDMHYEQYAACSSSPFTASRASSLPLGGQQLPGLYVFFDLAAHRFARFLDVVTAL